MLLSNIHILILENSKDDAESIRNGLLCIEEGCDTFNEKNINIYLVEEKNISDVYKVFVEKIKINKIDVVFIDLNLLNDYEDGMKIIRSLVEDEPEIKSIPKYIISSQNVKSSLLYSEVKHFTNLFIQKPSNGIQTYEEIFIDNKLPKTLPTLVHMYREIKKSFETQSILENIKFQLDKIEKNTDAIIEKTNLIEGMNQTMIKLFPLTLSDEKQKEKIKEFIQNDMSKYLEIDDNFFPEEKVRKKFIDAISEQFDEIVKDGLKEEFWGSLKDGIKEVAKTQGIDDENAGLCAVKLVYRSYSEVSKFVRGE